MTDTPVKAHPETNPAPRHSTLKNVNLEPFLVAITAACIAASLIGERAGAPGWLILVFNVGAYLAGGWFGVKAGMASLGHGEINVDLLMVLAAVGAALVNQWREGAILLFLFSLSNVLQQYAMDRSRNAIKALMKLRPNEATVRRDGVLTVVPVESLVVGDIVVIRPGERFPIDGRVNEGQSNVDQSSITGESMPVWKQSGDDVFAGTVNQNGSLEILMTRAVNDTTLARIIKMVEEAQDQRAPTQRFLEEFEQKYAKIVIGTVALFIIFPPLLLGVSFESNFYKAMVLLTVASPCALVISTPAAILSGIARGAQRGILFKGGAYLEHMATLKAVALDKTGTITTGRPVVTDVIPFGALSPQELLRLTAVIEAHSEHPVAQAVTAEARRQSLALGEPDSFEALPGMGVRGEVEGKLLHVGTARLMQQEGLSIPPELADIQAALESEGKTTLLSYRDGWLGLIAVADEIRPNAAEVIKGLHQTGITRVVILTGDNERVAAGVAHRVGADEVRANLLPEDKLTAIKALEKQYGAVAMVGDGVNDAPALAAATIGVAMGAAGTDVALETADVVLMADDLSSLAFAIHLSRRARRIMLQNITFALGVIVVLVLSALGLNLPMTLGVVGHEGSTLLVVLNGLRLLMVQDNRSRSKGLEGVSVSAISHAPSKPKVEARFQG